MISTATVIDSASNKEGVVMLGSTVVVKDMEFGDEETYTIVGTTEADPSKTVFPMNRRLARQFLDRK